MSEGENAVTGPVAGNVVRRWSATHRRSIWSALALAGAGGAGFGAAVLAGVSPAFGQPLATLLGGAGVLTAGLLAYFNGQHGRTQTEAHHKADMDRERERHAEDSRRAQVSTLRDRYTAIAAQIADESAAIRQAGVYALAALADDWHAFGEDEERQVCINLLQWYLRVPFPESDDPEKPDLSEREIRQTIVAILTERHRRPAEHPKSWAETDIDLQQASLPNCNLIGVYFNSLRFFQADLSGAGLSGANLIGANMLEVDLTAAGLFRTNLIGAELTRANLTDADLTDADLTSANLTNANLTRANLTRANLTRAYLNWADLTGADLSGADLTDARLISGANLTDIVYDEHTQWPEGSRPPQPDLNRR